MLAIGVPTAIADLTEAIRTAQLTKPIAAVLLDRAESVSLVDRPPAEGVQAASFPRLPVYGFPESAARALGHAASYGQWRDREHGQVPELAGLEPAAARALIAAFLIAHPEGGWLAAADAIALLGSYQIPVVQTRPVASEAAAVAVATELGGHVVLKADVTGLVHKTEAGAVRLGLRTSEEVAGAYADLVRAFGPDLRQVLIQPMLSDGVETLVGVAQDPVFGPLVVFGLGGVTTDVPGDHAARLAPLTDADAAQLIRSAHGAPLLLGRHGSAAVDTTALADLLLRVSRLADDVPEIAELDLTPVIVRAEGVYALDARIRVRPAAPHDPFLRHLR